MCGLAGILRTDGEPIPEIWLDRLDEAIAHRGPDGQGRFRDRTTGTDAIGERVVEVALVHRRLAVLDRAGGAQPMSIDAPSGAVTVAFNGCIYNHRALRTDLERRGHRFRSDHADTETLLHGWREHSTALPERLEGMYAIALWDAAAGALFLARDPFGEKPLWIARPGPGIFAFASHAAALTRLWPDATSGATADAVADFLRRGHGWIGRGGRAGDALVPLAPGCWLRVDARGAVSHGFHHRHPESAAPGNAIPSVEEFDRAVESAVSLRLDADVPLGCFLSGGVDSAVVAAMARRHLSTLRTFCVRMPDPALDESARAAAIAAHLGTHHTTLDPESDGGAGAADDVVHLLAQIGVPFGDSSILPTHWVSRAAQREVTVALSGDGGDELFLGYRRHVLADHIARHRWLLRHLPRRALGSTVGRVRDIAVDLPTTGALAFAAPFPERLVRSLVPDAPAPRPLKIEPGALGAMRTLRRHDLESYLPDDLLLKVDTASMAVALEVRSPMLDRALSSLALRTPVTALLNAPPCRGRKAMLRAVARRHLPASLVDGPKRGFAIPIGRWWRSDFGGLGTLLRDALGGAEPFGSLPIDAAAARGLLAEHLAGSVDHGQRLFLLLSLSLWASRRSQPR